MADPVQLKLRVPRELKAWLEEQAARNGSSQASEVIRALRERADRVQTKQGT